MSPFNTVYLNVIWKKHKKGSFNIKIGSFNIKIKELKSINFLCRDGVIFYFFFYS